MTLLRFRVIWRGLAGGTGVNVLHFGQTPEYAADAVATCAGALDAFYTEVAKYLPSTVSVIVDQQVEEVKTDNGEILNIYGGPALSAKAGFATGGYSAPSGAVVHWMTNDVKNSKRVRGRTFLVPLAGTQYEANGTLVNSSLTAITTAANTLAAREDCQLSVYRRPLKGKTSTGLPGADILVPGSQHRVTGVRVPDKAAMLTSRRD